MLNELISSGYQCPVCGRKHYYIPLDDWWCDYCRYPFQEKFSKLSQRLLILEKQLIQNQNIMYTMDDYELDIENEELTLPSISF